MKLSKLQALGAALALFVAVYFPAFAAVSLLRPPEMLGLYFGAGASIQEEVIFRGLLQSFLQEQWA